MSCNTFKNLGVKPKRIGIRVSPGDILLKEFLEPSKLSAEHLAIIIETSPVLVQNVIENKQEMTVDLAIRLSKYFGTTFEFWVNLQKNYNEACKSEN